MRVLVIVPTYNEAENIAALIREVRNLDIDPEILIIDDNSPDGTANIVKTIMERDPKVHLIERPKKMGLGSAYITGFKWALDRNFDVVVEMDADFSHDPKDIKRLVENLENCDAVIGSRYVKGVSVVNWPISRLLLSYFANLYARVITGVKIRDLTSGFKAIKTEYLRVIDLDGIKSDGYAFQIELHFNLWFKGFKVCEIPIIFVERRAGKSKLNKGIIWEAFWMVLKLGLRRMFKRV
ncbi:polyprenol monophosphomannose synthase [Candidatus Caldipriscus sp.]|nr:polyprenol monophosphomannose synthase [Candidatus Caldipriscus sp.]